MLKINPIARLAEQQCSLEQNTPDGFAHPEKYVAQINEDS
jgi:hypothetical protein